MLFVGRSWANSSRQHLKRIRMNIRSSVFDSDGLRPIGQALPVQPVDEPYQPGTYFIHKQLGYRGLIVSDWKAPTVTFHPSLKHEEEEHEEVPLFGTSSQTLHGHELQLTSALQDNTPWQVEMCPTRTTNSQYYQVFGNFEDIASLDIEHSCASWFFGRLVPGVDHVLHEDMLPIAPDKPFVQNAVTEKLFLPATDGSARKPSVQLAAWIQYAQAALSSSSTRYSMQDGDFELSACAFDVYELDTRGIGSATETQPYTWVYTISIRYKGKSRVQLLERTWRIIDDSGTESVVAGSGVVGRTPELIEGGFFQYTSQAFLQGPSGMMGGFLTFVDLEKDNVPIHVTIPTMNLTSVRERTNNE